MPGSLPATVDPLWYGREHTGCDELHHVAFHRATLPVAIEDHPSPRHELLIVESGELALAVDGTTLRVGGMQGGLTPDGSRVRSVRGDNRGRFYWLGLDPGPLRRMHGEALLDPRMRRALDDWIAAHATTAFALDDALLRAVRDCFRLVHRGDANRFLLRAAALRVMGSLLALNEAGDGSEAWAGVAPALDLIETDIEEHHYLRDLAAACHMSRSAFDHAFRRATGRSPRDYITRRKIERATTLLRSGEAVGPVAARLGFSSSQYFATVYKRHTGRRPSDIAAV
jgi:AraC-like DNA-binding protein